MPRRKSSEPWVHPKGLTLKEMVGVLPYYGVNVSFHALRLTARILSVPSESGRGENDRGLTAYYAYEALFMFATAYRLVAPPKSKFEKIAERLRDLESQETSPCEPYSIADEFEDEPAKADVAPRDLEAVARAYLRFVCDDEQGLDVAILSKVAKDHWHECGLDNQRVAEALRVYKIRQLTAMGVPGDVAAKVPLSGA